MFPVLRMCMCYVRRWSSHAETSIKVIYKEPHFYKCRVSYLKHEVCAVDAALYGRICRARRGTLVI